LPYCDLFLDLNLFSLDDVPFDTGEHSIFLAFNLNTLSLIVCHLYVGVSSLLVLKLLLVLKPGPVFGSQFVLLDPAARKFSFGLTFFYFPIMVPLELVIPVLSDFETILLVL
jgi:hypothetical protein